MVHSKNMTKHHFVILFRHVVMVVLRNAIVTRCISIFNAVYIPGWVQRWFEETHTDPEFLLDYIW